VAITLVTIGPRLMPALAPAIVRTRTTTAVDEHPRWPGLHRSAGRGQRNDSVRARGQVAGEGGFDVRPLVFLAVAMACAVAASNAMGSFVVPGAVHDGVTPGLAGLLSAASSVVGLSARIGFGWRVGRRDMRGRRNADDHLATVTLLYRPPRRGVMPPSCRRVRLDGMEQAATCRTHPCCTARMAGRGAASERTCR
jgi:hypothetical protein